MTQLDFESDTFLTLLTDALRAGPGSPAWHEALQQLRSGGIEHADEYRLLVTARQHLESGRSYRSIRAGGEFTRRVLAAIEEESTRRPRSPAATTLIAFGAAAVVFLVVLIVGYMLWTAQRSPSAPEGPTLLVNTVTYASFSDGIPSDWRMIGQLPIEFVHGAMCYASQASPATQPLNNTVGGGATWTQPLPPGEPFALIVSVRVHHLEDNLIAQVFVTDTPEFNDENATTPHELVWLIQGHQAQVILPNGRVQAQMDLPKNYHGDTVRVSIDHDQANVELGGRKFWSGVSGLEPGKPHYVGVRFLRRAADASGDGVVFQSVRVNTRQK